MFSNSLFLSVLLLLPSVCVAAQTITVCEAGDSSNPESCSATDALRVIQSGSKIHEEARFPLTFLGDWEKILVAPQLHVIATEDDVAYSEGPIVRGQRTEEPSLYVSSPPRGIIYRKSEGKQGLEVWATHAGGIDPSLPEHEKNAEPGSNGMATDVLDPRFVVINQHGLRRVVRCRLDDHVQGLPLSDCPDFEVVVDSFATIGDDHGEETRFRFNSPNDVVVHPQDGSIWFTDPIYGLLEKDRFCDELNCETGASYLDEKSEIGWKGVYRVERKTNALEMVAKHHRRPNGLAITPDLKSLWVSDSTIGSPSLTSYDLNNIDQTVSGSSSAFLSKKATKVLNPATLGTALGTSEGLPFLTGSEGLTDGFKIDELGFIWTSIPNGVAVIDAANNEVICQILLGVNTSNLAFGTNGDVWITGKGVWRLQRKMPKKEV